jgi:hypothetical protein
VRKITDELDATSGRELIGDARHFSATGRNIGLENSRRTPFSADETTTPATLTAAAKHTRRPAAAASD